MPIADNVVALSAQREAGDPQYSYEARFGPIIAKDGVAGVPNALFDFQAELNLSVQQVWFLSCILRYRWTADKPYPSMNTIAKNSGMSRRQLVTYQEELIEKGLLRITHRFTRGGGKTSNAFDVEPLLNRLEKLIIQKAKEEKANHVKPAAQGANKVAALVKPTAQGDVQAHSHPLVKTTAYKEEALKENNLKQMQEVWSAALTSLAREVNTHVFSAVFADTRLISLSQSQAVVVTSNQSAMPNLERYTSRVSNCMSKLGYAVSVKFVLAD